MNATQTILILGGTGEARQLAQRLVALGHDVTTSLAGRTEHPIMPHGKVRAGGFGGAKGLADTITAQGCTHLIDATHPFAAQISANAVAAQAMTGVPLIRLQRPHWEQPEGAVWIDVPTMQDAAEVLPAASRVLLTIGRQEVSAFFGRRDCQFVARVIEAPDAAPDDWTVLTARGPFALADEIALLREYGITHLVSKNAGGPQAAAKLEAAATLGVPVVMVQRPHLPEAETVASVDAVVTWVTG